MRNFGIKVNRGSVMDVRAAAQRTYITPLSAANYGDCDWIRSLDTDIHRFSERRDERGVCWCTSWLLYCPSRLYCNTSTSRMAVPVTWLAHATTDSAPAQPPGVKVHRARENQTDSPSSQGRKITTKAVTTSSTLFRPFSIHPPR